MVAHLNAEAFEYYFDHFTEENAPTEAAKSFQVVKQTLLAKFSTKKTESETMKEAMNLTYQDEDVKEFYARASKLYKEAYFNEGLKHGMTMEPINSDQSLLQFVLLRKAWTFDDVRETCLEYAEHKNLDSLLKKVTGNASGVLHMGEQERQRGTHEKGLDKMDMLCKWRFSLRRASQNQAFKT